MTAALVQLAAIAPFALAAAIGAASILNSALVALNYIKGIPHA